MIRQEPHYRRDAFMSGLKAAGYDARTGPPQNAAPGDVMVCWNRYNDVHELATRFEKHGGTVLVAENGYLGPGGVSPHQMEPREWYALAIGGHNGSGTWHVGGSERWKALGVELQPWREKGEYILVCPNRSFGRPDLIMPLRWAEDVKARIAKITKRPVVIRPHPGNDPHHKRPLAEDLKDAKACVVWSSSAGVQALIAGVPVYCECPKWVCKSATLPPIGARDLLLNLGAMDHTRLDAMIGLAWAQWHVSEIASGEPFEHLLQREPVAA